MAKKNSLVYEFEQWLKKGYDDGAKYFKAVYLTERNEAIPQEFIGDDITDNIRAMFCRPLEFISDRLSQKKVTAEFAIPIIDASWEDSTYFCLTYKGRVLHSNHYKAWHFYFENRGALNEFLTAIWNECLEKIEKMVDDADLYLFQFKIRQGEYEYIHTHTLRAKNDDEALQKAKDYLKDFYGESGVEIEDDGMICRYNHDEVIGEIERVEKIDIKDLLSITEVGSNV